MIVDPTKLFATFNHYADLVKSADKWVGNWAPNPQHFDPDTIHCDAGIEPGTQRVWFAHSFVDLDGRPRHVRASMDATKIGVKGGNDVITIDGQDVQGDDFTIAAKFGWWGLRFAFEYHWTDSSGQKIDLRFDGV